MIQDINSFILGKPRTWNEVPFPIRAWIEKGGHSFVNPEEQTWREMPAGIRRAEMPESSVIGFRTVTDGSVWGSVGHKPALASTETIEAFQVVDEVSGRLFYVGQDKSTKIMAWQEMK